MAIKHLAFLAVGVVMWGGEFASANTSELIASGRIINIPCGHISLTHTLVKGPVKSKKLRLQFGGTPECGDTKFTRLEYATDPAFSKYLPAKNIGAGIYETDGKEIYQFRYNMWHDQCPLLKACTYYLYTEESEPVNPPIPTPIVTPPKLAGVIAYKGGFLHRTRIALSLSKVKSFKVAIPQFCKDVEIVEAGTSLEGAFESATPTEGSPLVFNAKEVSGTKSDGVVVTLNGPENISCAIPVYVSEIP